MNYKVLNSKESAAKLKQGSAAEFASVLFDTICCNKEIATSHGHDGIFGNKIFSFEKVKEILSGFGFEYLGGNDERKRHRFRNTGTSDWIYIYPKTYYPNLGNFRFFNLLLYSI